MPLNYLVLLSDIDCIVIYNTAIQQDFSQEFISLQVLIAYYLIMNDMRE